MKSRQIIVAAAVPAAFIYFIYRIDVAFCSMIREAAEKTALKRVFLSSCCYGLSAE